MQKITICGRITNNNRVLRGWDEDETRTKKKMKLMKNIKGAMKICGVKEMQIEIEKASSSSTSSTDHDHLISHLPALGAHSHHKVKLHCYIISPFNSYYR